MIKYDHKKLEEILGGPIEELAEKDTLGRQTARALIDCYLTVESQTRGPDAAFSNAKHWIKYAYENGLQKGHEDAKFLFKRKIMHIFGL